MADPAEKIEPTTPANADPAKTETPADVKPADAKPAATDPASDPAADPTKKTETPADAKPAEPEKGFPTDWRERSIAMMGLTGDDATKEMERLKRASSPAEALRQGREAERKITQLSESMKSMIKVPTKDSAPEEVKAFDKAWGVPESVDEYVKALPDRPKELGVRTEEDVAALKAVMPVFQSKKFSKDQMATMVAAMDQYELTAKQQAAAAANLWRKESEETLRQEWNGKGQFDVEVEIANRTAEKVLGNFMSKEERQEFFNLTLDNGRTIGSYPAVVKAFNRLGREGFDAVDTDTLPETGEPVSAQSIDQEIAKLAALAHTGRSEDEAKYNMPETQQRLKKLIERKGRIEARGRA